MWSPFFKTHPGGPWYDRDQKTFLLGLRDGNHKERKDAALREAQEWAAAQYGVTEWAKNRQGDYVAKEANDKFPIPKRDRLSAD